MTYQTIIAYKDGSCKVAGQGGKAPWWGKQKNNYGTYIFSALALAHVALTVKGGL